MFHYPYGMELYWSVVFAFIGVSAGLTVQTLDEDVGEVVLVNMLYRSGERAVDEYLEGDPLTELKYWPRGYGQLTNIGIQHQYNLGKWLGQRYKNLIPGGLYNSSLFYFVSVESDWTIMSSEANLAGMFPPVGEDVWSKTLSWQPIPVHVVSKDEDYLLNMTAPCPPLDQLYRQMTFPELNAKYSNLWKSMATQFPNIDESPAAVWGNVVEALDDINSELANNLEISAWAKENYQQMAEAYGLSMAMLNWTPQMMQYVGGPLLKEILDSMQAKAGGSPINIIGYSSHETTIGVLLNAMGMYNYLPPPFAATVLIELRKTKDNQFVVTTLYQNNTNPEDEPFLLTPNGCDAACPLDKFVAMYQNVIPSNLTEMCQENDSSSNSSSSDSSSSENSTEDYSGNSTSQEIVEITEVEGPGFDITDQKVIDLYGPGVDYVDLML